MTTPEVCAALGLEDAGSPPDEVGAPQTGTCACVGEDTHAAF